MSQPALAVNSLNVSNITSEADNCQSDFEFNVVQNEAKYNKSGNNTLIAKAKNTGYKITTSPLARFFIVAPRSLVSGSLSFRGNCWLHVQGRCHNLEDHI
jgi:hypothetical protein